MATYLITWNPKRWKWEDRRDLQRCIAKIEEQGYCEDRWSCGNTRRIKQGDRLFLMRLGKDPKGIVGSGFATSDVYEDKHWEPGHPGIARYIDLNFDALLDSEQEPTLSLSELSDISTSTPWIPQSSGVTIEDQVASKLEARWTRFLNSEAAIRTPQEVKGSDVLYEGGTRQITVNAYERNSAARRDCIAHYGHSCSACGFSFEEKYGDVGKDFIHIHHLVPLSEVGEEYEVNPKKDLRPVCPNCHAIIHKKKPPYTIDEVRELLAAQPKRRSV
jgi:5-methylcytosine-specific restriction enzyme A